MFKPSDLNPQMMNCLQIERDYIKDFPKMQKQQVSGFKLSKKHVEKKCLQIKKIGMVMHGVEKMVELCYI